MDEVHLFHINHFRGFQGLRCRNHFPSPDLACPSTLTTTVCLPPTDPVGFASEFVCKRDKRTGGRQSEKIIAEQKRTSFKNEKNEEQNKRSFQNSNQWIGAILVIFYNLWQNDCSA